MTSLFLVALLPACGGGPETETTPQYEYPDQTSFCAALALAECNDSVVQACYGSDSTTLGDDKGSCAAARKANCNPKGLPYHPEQAEDCLDARKSGLSDALWTHDELDKVAAACAPVFSKKGPDGAVCTSDDDCDTGASLHCVVKLGSLQGVCAAPKVAGGGEDCKDPATVCTTGFYCDPKVSHCLAEPAQGEACSDAAPCASDFYCTASEAGMCAVKTKNGAKCTADALCAGGFCLGATAMVEGICSSTEPLQINSTACSLYHP